VAETGFKNENSYEYCCFSEATVNPRHPEETGAAVLLRQKKD